MKKFKIAITTLLIVTFIGFLSFYFFLNNPFTVENTIDEEIPRTNIQAEIEANEYINQQYKGTQTAMDWGPVLLGKIAEDVMLVSLGYCSGECPENSFIVEYLMTFKIASKEQCKSAWGYDLNIVIDGSRYCLFQIPADSCEAKGGSAFYDSTLDVYLGCSASQYPDNY